MFQRKFEDAIEPSERAYYIRMRLLGNHPQTVHSIFQQGVLQANLGHLNKALQLFLDGWEMEKTLSDLSGNKEDIHLIEREELWFFKGMCKEYKETLQVGG
ncbi:unnamed protein product [Pocillopora meandrina]|uniref:Uncharacterized protein n=1 Tax=Pocillopora meandrina TaxID=46732 RepID=A0AAU9W3H0_9CNID|nr:unnamed protein product [Pocillopora meandrina]